MVGGGGRNERAFSRAYDYSAASRLTSSRGQPGTCLR